MSVIGRSTSSVILDSGEVASVLVENLAQAVQPSSLLQINSDQQTNGIFRVARDRLALGQIEQVGWGVGTRVLFLTVTEGGVPTQAFTPVVALLPGVEAGGQPARGTFLESIVDPVITYDSIRKRVSLLYFVNAWSPPLPGDEPLPGPPPPITLPGNSPTLFSSVVPPLPTLMDYDYYLKPSYLEVQPFKDDFTGVRDVPNWYSAEDVLNLGLNADDIPGSLDESVGPFDLARFFIAPFTDAHLYRFPESLDGLSDPSKQPKAPPPLAPPPLLPPPPIPSPPGPPLPPTGSSDLLQLFPFMTVPQTNVTNATLAVLYKVQNDVVLTSLEEQTYDCYKYALARIMGLTRCTRVLMRADGFFYNLQIRQDGSRTGKPATYLVVSHPKPVMAFPRGINKVLVGRPKITSFIGTDTYITAAMTYRYPAAGSVTLCGGNPQVDFTIHSPSDRFDENRRMGLLSEAQTPQHAPFDASATYTIPGAYGTSVIELLSNPTLW